MLNQLLRVCLIVTVVTTIAQAHPLHAQTFSPYVDSSGNISLPEDFATKFQHLGTIAVSAKPNEPVNQLHHTYTRQEDAAAFAREGRFSDGAILVKEVRNTAHAQLTTGSASYASDVNVWFVMVKDSTNRFPNNELWGDGWGWALFEGKDRTKQVAVNYRTECRSCHVPANKTDWIYTQCYPALATSVKKSATKDVSEGQGTKPDLVAMFPQWQQAQSLHGDIAAGRKYFQSKTIGNAMTCQTCHSFDRADTMSLDADGLIRAGFPIYASAHRTNIKNSGTNLAALGGNVCTIHFMGAKEPGMTAQELRDMSAFLASGGGKAHPTAANIDYTKATWTIPDILTGGDAVRGEEFAKRSCITCHNVGQSKAKIVQAGNALEKGSYGSDDLHELVLQIRNPDYKHNAEMPGYTDLRLSTQQLLDLLAWLTAK